MQIETSSEGKCEKIQVAIINPPSVRPLYPLYAQIYLKAFIDGGAINAKVYDLNNMLFAQLWSPNHWADTVLGQQYSLESFCDYFKRVSLINQMLTQIYKPFLFSPQGIVIDKAFSDIRDLFSFALSSGNHFTTLFGDKFDWLFENNDILMFSINTIEQLVATISIVKRGRERKACKVLIGGSLIQRFLNDLLCPEIFSYIDVLAYSDGEECNRLYAEHILQGKTDLGDIPGIVYLKDGHVQKTAIAISTRALINKPQYIDYSDLAQYTYPTPKVIFPIMATRECYYRKCVFCNNHKNGSKEFRYRTAENILNDLKNAKETCNANLFRFIDDAIPLNVIDKLSDLIIKEKMQILWGANARFEHLLAERSFVQKLYKSGCRLLFLGIESGSDSILASMNKGTNTQRIVAILRELKSVGITTHVSFLFGFPTESEDDAKATCSFIRRNIELLDIIEINYFSLTHDSPCYSVIKNYDNIEIRGRKLCSSIVDFVYKDTQLPVLQHSYQAYLEMKEYCKAAEKQPSLWNITNCFI